MTDRQVLFETILAEAHPLQILNEGQGKDLYLEGLCIQGEVRNHNGRIYPAKEIGSAVQQLNERIHKHGPVIGECDHPSGLNINLDRATHLILEMKMNGADGHGRFKIVPYGLGAVMEGFVRHGARLGVSSRGSGNVDPDGRVSEFDIVTIDIVANPSAPNAYPKAIYESLQGSKQGRETLRLADAIRHDPKAQQFFQKELLTFLSNLNPRKR